MEEIDLVHCESMWNLLVAQLQDAGQKIFPRTLCDFFLGDLIISSDEVDQSAVVPMCDVSGRLK